MDSQQLERLGAVAIDLPDLPPEGDARERIHEPRRPASRRRESAAGVSRDGSRDASSSDVLAAYLRSIGDIPVLSKEETFELSRIMEAEEGRFRRALGELPGTSLAVLERWTALRGAGRVTASHSSHNRDGSGRDWGREVDTRLRRLERLLLERPLRRAELAAALNRAQISFEVLREIYADLKGAVEQARGRNTAALRRLGLASRAARGRLHDAAEALLRHDEAKRTFVHHNLRLVVKCARRYRNMGVAFMDLIQEGNLGLIRAVEKFDHRRGFMFSTYAVWWINQSLIRVIQNQSRTVRVPSHICELQVRWRNVERDLSRRLGRDPEPAEMARALGLAHEEVDRVAATMSPIRSLHAPLQGLDDVSFEEALPDDEAPDPVEEVDREEMSGAVHGLLSSLSDRERQILAWRFGLQGDESGITLGEIGERLGISRERVRQIEGAALARLRHTSEAQGLRFSIGLDAAESCD